MNKASSSMEGRNCDITRNRLFNPRLQCVYHIVVGKVKIIGSLGSKVEAGTFIENVESEIGRSNVLSINTSCKAFNK